MNLSNESKKNEKIHGNELTYQFSIVKKEYEILDTKYNQLKNSNLSICTTVKLVTVIFLRERAG